MGQKIEKISGKTVKVICIIILAWITWWQMNSTFRLPFDYQQEYILEYPDSPLSNIFLGIVFMAALFLLQKILLRGDAEKQKKRVLILAIVDVAVVGIFLTYWVSIARIEPYWDQLQVLLTTQKFRLGDYSDMNTLYFGMFTQQYGLIWFEELFLWIWNDYRMMQYVNVVLIMLIIFFFYRVTDLLFSNQKVNLYCLIGVTIFIPMHVYVVYLYGDLGAIAFGMIAVWGLLKWNATGKKRYLPIMLASATLAVFLRYASLIILVAILIVSIVYAWRKWNWRPLAVGIAMLIVPILCIQLLQGYYELRSGNEIGKGLPATVWISMGMQGDIGDIGLDTGYDESIWWQSNSDPVATSEWAVSDIKQKLEEFKGNPSHARELLRYKILEQWIEPTFSSLTLTGKFDEAAHPLVDKVYFSSLADQICRFMNKYLFVLYAGALIYAVRSLFEKENIYTTLLYVIFIGGFLFGIIWEAKGRYMMPYAMYLIPYMAGGISFLLDSTEKAATKLIQKVGLKKKEISE